MFNSENLVNCIDLINPSCFMSVKNAYGSKLSSLLTPDDIEIFNNKENIDTLVLKLLEKLALNYGIGNIKQIYKSFKDNNFRSFPIKLSDQVHVYHFRLATTTEIQIAIAFANNGIDFNPGKVKILIVVVAPNDRPDMSLKAETALKSVFCNENIKKSLFTCIDPQCIWSYIDQSNECLPSHIYAGDIMTEALDVLNENNTLKDAIDLITQSNHLNIPVIDSENQLVGEVNADELMKICLPRYILWMDDTNPIVNFESFYNILQHEENTWLTEIMTQDIATVQVQEYAMKAAIAMIKKEVKCVYVLNNKTLVGIITLEHFLNRVLRK